MQRLSNPFEFLTDLIKYAFCCLFSISMSPFPSLTHSSGLFYYATNFKFNEPWSISFNYEATASCEFGVKLVIVGPREA